MNVKQRVGEILRKYPATRSSDRKLIWAYGEEYHNWGPSVISMDQYFDMPSFESITRGRRYRQNKQGMYLAPKEVQEAREDQQHLHIEQFA